MTDFELALRSHRVALPTGEAPATIAIRDGRIAAILGRTDPVSADRTVDLADDVLLPGLVDTHVHINEPGRTEWEGFATATAAAAAGGVTTIMDMPLNSIPPTLDRAALRAKRAAAHGKCKVDVGYWGGAVPGNLAELAGLRSDGVSGFKCFLSDSGVPEFPALDGPNLEAAFREIARLDALVLVHAENPASLSPSVNGPHYRDFLKSRPERSEVEAVAQVVRLATRTGTRIHILHVSSAAAADLIAEAKRSGASITAETCPHYLTLEAESVPPGATEFKCCPPIRDRANRDRLWAALADGTIDCVVSDHSPATPELKLTGDFGTAWGGIASLQLGLPLLWTEARRRGHELTDVTRWLSTNPANLADLKTKGAITIGGSADLVRFSPEAEFTVDPQLLAHRHPVSPYAGRQLRGRVRETWLAGTRIHSSEPANRDRV